MLKAMISPTTKAGLQIPRQSFNLDSYNFGQMDSAYLFCLPAFASQREATIPLCSPKLNGKALGQLSPH